MYRCHLHPIEQPKETLYQVIPTEEVTLWDEEVILVESVVREDEKKDQEETQDCQRSIPYILDPRHPEQPSNVMKIQSPRLWRH